MPEETKILLSWKIPEHVRHQRSRLWFFIVAVIGGLFIVYGVLTNDFLFALIIVLFAVVYILMHMQEPPFLDFNITDRGIELGNKKFEYNDITSFWVAAREGRGSLHLRTKYFSSPLLSIPLDSANPDAVRGVLNKYVTEDASEKEEPLSELLSRRFKL